jgi:hypothetical protein
VTPTVTPCGRGWEPSWPGRKGTSRTTTCR